MFEPTTAKRGYGTLEAGPSRTQMTSLVSALVGVAILLDGMFEWGIPEYAWEAGAFMVVGAIAFFGRRALRRR